MNSVPVLLLLLVSDPTGAADGVTVCLRYFAELGVDQTLFSLRLGNYNVISLRSDGFQDVLSYPASGRTASFRSYRYLWNSGLSPWSSLCVTLDTKKGVAQLYRGGKVSIRKRFSSGQTDFPRQAVFSVSGLEGEVTDVEVWDSLLDSGYLRNYLQDSYYSYPAGSLLSWRQACYSTQGDVLLERSPYTAQHRRSGPKTRKWNKKGKGKGFRGGHRGRREGCRGGGEEGREGVREERGL